MLSSSRYLLLVVSLITASVMVSSAVGEETKKTKTPDCVFVPTPYDVVEKMLEMANLQHDDIVYDLGCGNGRMVVQAAKRCGCRGVGYEIVPSLAEEARQNARDNDVSDLIEIREEDLFQADFGEATVLPLYLLPSMLKKLKPQLAQLKPGTRIVSHDYRIAGADPDAEIVYVSKETNAEHILLLYTLPFHSFPDWAKE